MGNMKYKAGDKVRIKSIDWYNDNKNERNEIIFENNPHWRFVANQSDYCGQIVTITAVSETAYRFENIPWNWTDEMIEGLVDEEISLDKAGQITDFEYEGLAYTLPEGYIFKDENGNVINTTKIVLEKKKKEYPTTYEECCKVMGVNHTNTLDICEHCDYKTEITYYEDSLLEKIEALYRLRICRDAYWKIAGEEMGLGKSWEPDWESLDKKYNIYNYRGDIKYDYFTVIDRCLLVFPTAEMRDAFYENFKELINECKELL